MSIIRCCYKCEERKVGCHSTCEKYLAERKVLDEEMEERKKRSVKRDIIWDTYLNGLKNMKNVRNKYNEQRKRK